MDNEAISKSINRLKSIKSWYEAQGKHVHAKSIQLDIDRLLLVPNYDWKKSTVVSNGIVAG